MFCLGSPLITKGLLARDHAAQGSTGKTLVFVGMARMQCLNMHAVALMVLQRSAYKNLNAGCICFRPFTTTVRLCIPGDADSRRTYNRLESLQKQLRMININPQSNVLARFQKCLCPQCGGGSNKEKSLSVFINAEGDYASWICFRAKCGWQSDIQRTLGPVRSSLLLDTANLENGASNSAEVKATCNFTEESLQLEQLSPELSEYFAERLISKETLQRNGVLQAMKNNQVVIAFTYRKNGRIVNCKYRDQQKMFWLEKPDEMIPYGLDDILGAEEIIIVEGEIDKLSMEEAGYKNCISVAPIEKDTKYEYLYKFKQYFDKATHIILATDADEPGRALAEEIARRIGREKCSRVVWPKIMGDTLCMDANEVLLRLGPQVLKKLIVGAEHYPIRGLYSFRDYFDEIDAYYQCYFGNELGLSTGWTGLDELYRVVPGELTIVTGVPNSGKSEWIDALMCNLNRHNGWKFALCSMENKVREHARKLLEKHIKKPFFSPKYGDYVSRMSVDELEQGKQWLNETFFLIRYEDEALPSIQWVIKLAKGAVLRHGIHGLVIDPYNELDHQRPSNQSETEYVSQMLTLVKRFAQHYGCHVWFVAHPRQLQNWNGGPPGLYDISGSAHFINKCDNGIVIHRNRDVDAGPLDQVQVLIRKVRNKVAGTIGEACLRYDRVTGEYFDAMG